MEMLQKKIKMYRTDRTKEDHDLLKLFEGIGSLLVLGSMALLSTGQAFEGWILAMLGALVWAIFAYRADHGFMLVLQIILFFIACNGVYYNG